MTQHASPVDPAPPHPLLAAVATVRTALAGVRMVQPVFAEVVTKAVLVREVAAARSPPRLSRCRPLVRPLLAGWGATPQSLAKAASLRIRSALSPPVTRN